MSRLPPDISQAIAYVKVETAIDAPVETVWNAILDFPAYTKWNPFVRYQVITDSSFKPLSAHPRPIEGAYILMRTRMPPRLDDDEQGLRFAKDIITYMDEANHRVVWDQATYPTWLLRAERWQEVTAEVVDGRTVAKYVLNGPMAWLVRWFNLPPLVVSFEAMAEGLKKHSEELRHIK